MKRTLLKCVAVLLCGVSVMSFLSCSDDPKQEEPAQKKRVSRITRYMEQAGEYVKFQTLTYKYDSQGRISEFKLINNASNDLLKESAEYTYSPNLVNVVFKIFPNNPGVATTVIDRDYEIDENGRVVRSYSYSYSDDDSTKREGVSASECVYEYDSEGHLISCLDDNGAFWEMEWQDGEMVKRNRNEGQGYTFKFEFTPSQIPVDIMMPINHEEYEEWLMLQGYMGKLSPYLPAYIKKDLSDGLAVNEYEYEYELSDDGLVTTWYLTNTMSFMSRVTITTDKYEVDWQ